MKRFNNQERADKFKRGKKQTNVCNHGNYHGYYT